ncbi:carboxy methyl transferase for protein phosphatase 2A [Elasticomyces elasticus]|uniref:Leucine carboxyl methyltransferase 1 n=1 Tax=Exophiala sideris TaxID=1016849 RepID=A0ABR0IW12_9EURO|nr:carboxy methyl transferase for protein phosphatase 2A [Elasticomyces elasticus]KAK5021478.1 carboxy methyl transferase for protein phosphatase 2A [Exophiala sideris]KAK5049610.1 carboxy methyl transferase for protein phosphatase 2A [Exophiala sideris]
MSAPSIPNLNSLRSGGLRGRGRGRGGVAAGPPGSRRTALHDELVQNTDSDAATSRLSAVDAGYLEDPFAGLLTPGDTVSRRLPLMNRGTYVRTTGIDSIVDTFLSTNGNARKQIISLGAGSDTRYFRLKQKRRDLNLAYHEIDFESNTRKKIARLKRPPFSHAVKTLASVDTNAPNVVVSNDGATLISPDYTILPQDLRQLQHGNETLGSIDNNLPTLIISECCLIYLPPHDADAVLQYFSDLFPARTPLAIVIYEPIRPHDSFGRTMVSNLLSRGIHLQTLEKYAGLDEQIQRLEMHGFKARSDGTTGGSEAVDIEFIWREWIPTEEKERVEGLEWMDEVEEFVLFAKHYCISWGWRGYQGSESDLWHRLPSPTRKA